MKLQLWDSRLGLTQKLDIRRRWESTLTLIIIIIINTIFIHMHFNDQATFAAFLKYWNTIWLFWTAEWITCLRDSLQSVWCTKKCNFYSLELLMLSMIIRVADTDRRSMCFLQWIFLSLCLLNSCTHYRKTVSSVLDFFGKAALDMHHMDISRNNSHCL